MSGKFPNLIKTINLQIQEAHQPPPREAQKENIRYIIKTLKISNKNAIQEATQYHV